MLNLVFISDNRGTQVVHSSAVLAPPGDWYEQHRGVVVAAALYLPLST